MEELLFKLFYYRPYSSDLNLSDYRKLLHFITDRLMNKTKNILFVITTDENCEILYVKCQERTCYSSKRTFTMYFFNVASTNC